MLLPNHSPHLRDPPFPPAPCAQQHLPPRSHQSRCKSLLAKLLRRAERMEQGGQKCAEETGRQESTNLKQRRKACRIPRRICLTSWRSRCSLTGPNRSEAQRRCSWQCCWPRAFLLPQPRKHRPMASQWVRRETREARHEKGRRRQSGQSVAGRQQERWPSGSPSRKRTERRKTAGIRDKHVQNYGKAIFNSSPIMFSFPRDFPLWQSILTLQR
ncbi:uncharacterized protein WM294_005070 [Sarcoramphus papa]